MLNIISVISIIIVILYLLFMILNKLVKMTIWYRNFFVNTKQFTPFIENQIPKHSLDILNLGSNVALYAFFYENIRGVNLSSGSQNQHIDYCILKKYSIYLKKNGIVLIPIMPCTSLTPYLKNINGPSERENSMKFAKILGKEYSSEIPYYKKVSLNIKYPLLFSPKALFYIVRDKSMNNCYSISEQSMMKLSLISDAKKWINLWLNIFNLKNLEDCLDSRWNKYYEKAEDLTNKIVEYCLSHDLKPVFICTPMTSYLSSLFPEKVERFLVQDFIQKANKHNIPFLDYTNDERFKDASLYFNSFFLNMKGRKIFTKQVLADLKLI